MYLQGERRTTHLQCLTYASLDYKGVHSIRGWEVLKTLRANGIFAKLEKCEFGIDTVEFLGYIVSPNGISIDSRRFTTITEGPTPRTVKQVQSFLGFTVVLSGTTVPS